MHIATSVSQIRTYATGQRTGNKSIAFVPTMGALHEGHLSLVRQAKKLADIVIVSIYVNPKQFAAHEDLDRYPDRLEQDKILLDALDVDALYLPDHQEMYPEGFQTSIHLSDITNGLCSTTRPHFFDGVAIVVTKLLLQILPDQAIFGEKDFQQFKVIQRLVADLNIPTEIISGPIIREMDGLAMSSRNAYLSTQERRIAPNLYQALQSAKQYWHKHKQVEPLLQWLHEQLRLSGFDDVEYIEIRDQITLDPIAHYQSENARLLVAVRLQTCRLIDNIRLDI